MRILFLSSYPLAYPIHGGQHRAANICAALRHAGHDVDARGVLGSESYPPQSGYVRFPGYDKLRRYIADPTLLEDWAIGAYAADTAGGYRILADLCQGRYDAIFCEQPWLFAFAHRLAQQLKPAPSLIYGSQNIEAALKRDIMDRFAPARSSQGEALVREAELFAIRQADLVVAVSDHDRAVLAESSSVPVVVAANGVIDRRASLQDVELSNNLTEARKTALYCASGHPPNIQGFYDIFGDGLGCLAPEQRLIVAGGAGPSIVDSPQYARTSGLAAKIVAPGPVTETQLRGLLATAHVIILPITKGGGTNLKTAEALWSGRHVVATPTAMRGFENFSAARGVTVRADAPSFQAAIREAMLQPALQLTAAERQERASVLWGATLQPLVEAMNTLGRPS
jgi:hypothetical protein